jgi:hypothetical protein
MQSTQITHSEYPRIKYTNAAILKRYWIKSIRKYILIRDTGLYQ